MRIPIASLMTALALAAALSPALRADGLDNNEVVFTGATTSATVNGSGAGTVVVRLNAFDLRVLVNAKTQISYGDDPITMEDLADLVRTKAPDIEVAGKFSSSGTIATSIRVLDPRTINTFLVRGHITGIQVSGANAIVSLLGLKLTVTPDTKLTWDGVTVALSDLRIGTPIEAKGLVATDGTWTAEEIRVLSENMKRRSLRFEGTVLSYDSAAGVAVIDVAGALKNETKVLVTKSTRIEGDFKKGAYVRVTGVLNADLGVTASEIEVIPALELKPDERKLKVNETAVFVVSLRVAAADAVTVSLGALPTGVLELSKTSVVIARGSRTAEFSVKALKLGTAELTATAGPDKAVAEVLVGEVSEDENDVPGSEARISFAPDHIRMDVGDTRDVVLLIKPPQKNAVNVAVAPSNDKVKVEAETELGNGAASLKVTVRALAAGNSSVIAVLPQELGGAKAELVIEIGAKGNSEDKKLELAFRPSRVELKQGESRPVELKLSRPAPSDVAIALKQEGSALSGVPGTVSFKTGQIVASIKVTGDKVGKSQVTAALPVALGGATAVLDAEVKK